MAILLNSTTNQAEKDRWGTQWQCFNDAQVLTGFRFVLDACAEEATTKCANFISPRENALTVDWADRVGQITASFYNKTPAIAPIFRPMAIWCNPPFTQKPAFLERCLLTAKQGVPVVALIPYERATMWWRSFVSDKAAQVYLPDGRYNFLQVDGKTKKSGVNFATCFVVYSPSYTQQTQYIEFNRGL